MSFNLRDPFDISFMLGAALFLAWLIHALVEFRFLCFLGYHRPRTFEIQHTGELVIFRACIRCGHPEGIPETRGIGKLRSAKKARERLDQEFDSLRRAYPVGRETYLSEDI